MTSPPSDSTNIRWDDSRSTTTTNTIALIKVHGILSQAIIKNKTLDDDDEMEPQSSRQQQPQQRRCSPLTAMATDPPTTQQQFVYSFNHHDNEESLDCDRVTSSPAPFDHNDMSLYHLDQNHSLSTTAPTLKQPIHNHYSSWWQRWWKILLMALVAHVLVVRYGPPAPPPSSSSSSRNGLGS